MNRDARIFLGPGGRGLGSQGEIQTIVAELCADTAGYRKQFVYCNLGRYDEFMTSVAGRKKVNPGNVVSRPVRYRMSAGST